MPESNLGRIEEKLDNLLELMTGIRVDQATSRRDIDLLFSEMKDIQKREMSLEKDLANGMNNTNSLMRELEKDIDKLGEKVRDNSKMTSNISKVVWLIVAAVVTFAFKLIYDGVA